MPGYDCPRCGEASISLPAKYLAGKFATIPCPRCGARLSAHPLLLAAFYLLYLWDLIWFYGLYHFSGDIMNFVYMAVGWAILDVLNLQLIPLASLRPKRDD